MAVPVRYSALMYLAKLITPLSCCAHLASLKLPREACRRDCSEKIPRRVRQRSGDKGVGAPGPRWLLCRTDMTKGRSMDFRFNKKDRELLVALAEYRIVGVSQLARLHDRNVRALRPRLRCLEQQGLGQIDGQPLGRGRGRPEGLVSLRDQAVGWLQAKGLLPLSVLRAIGRALSRSRVLGSRPTAMRCRVIVASGVRRPGQVWTPSSGTWSGYRNPWSAASADAPSQTSIRSGWSFASAPNARPGSCRTPAEHRGPWPGTLWPWGAQPCGSGPQTGEVWFLVSPYAGVDRSETCWLCP